MPGHRIGNARKLDATPERLRRIWRAAREFGRGYPVGAQERANLLEVNWGHGLMGRPRAARKSKYDQE